MILQQSVSLEKFCYFHFWSLWLSTGVETQSKQLKTLVTARRSPTAEEVSIREHRQVQCVREGAYPPQSVSPRPNSAKPSISQTCLDATISPHLYYNRVIYPFNTYTPKGYCVPGTVLVAGRARLTLLAVFSLDDPSHSLALVSSFALSFHSPQNRSLEVFLKYPHFPAWNPPMTSRCFFIKIPRPPQPCWWAACLPMFSASSHTLGSFPTGTPTSFQILKYVMAFSLFGAFNCLYFLLKQWLPNFLLIIIPVRKVLFY